MEHYEQIRAILNSWGKKSDMLKIASDTPELERAKFYKFLSGKSVPQADTFVRWIERLGFTILSPREMKEGGSDASLCSLAENERLRAELAAAKESIKMFERILTAGLRREALPEDEKKDDDK